MNPRNGYINLMNTLFGQTKILNFVCYEIIVSDYNYCNLDDHYQARKKIYISNTLLCNALIAFQNSTLSKWHRI